MKQTDLEKLLADMSLKEKVDQMLHTWISYWQTAQRIPPSPTRATPALY